jgi:hypothetical protein
VRGLPRLQHTFCASLAEFQVLLSRSRVFSGLVAFISMIHLQSTESSIRLRQVNHETKRGNLEHSQDLYSGESVVPVHLSRFSRTPQARTQSPKNWRRWRRGWNGLGD